MTKKMETAQPRWLGHTERLRKGCKEKSRFGDQVTTQEPKAD